MRITIFKHFFSHGIGLARKTGALLRHSRVLQPHRRRGGGADREPSERLATLVAVLQRTRTAVPLVLLVIIARTAYRVNAPPSARRIVLLIIMI